MTKRLVIAIAALLTPLTSAAQDLDAKAELRAATLILGTRHMNRDKIDWAAVVNKAQALIVNPKEPSGAYPAIRYIIAQLGEHHTSLQSADMAKAAATGQSAGNVSAPIITPPQGYLLADDIGLMVEDFMVGPASTALAYAEGGQAVLRRFADAKVCRFILDLRGNSGGNMYPMLAGVAALLGPEPYGYFSSPGAVEIPWTPLASLGLNDKVTPALPASLQRAPVAVLIDNGTLSAGEYTAMAFEGRSNTRFFGEETGGFVSANATHRLPDGASLVVSEGWGRDRNHTLYQTALRPDEAAPRGQQTVDAAINWLKKQKCE